MITNTMITTTVRLRASSQVGQDTLRNSPSRLAEETLDPILAFTFFSFTSHVELLLTDGDNAASLTARKGRAALYLQARQELNPQPLVLETSALPIELLAYDRCSSVKCHCVT